MNEYEMVGQAVLLFQHALGQKGCVLQAGPEEVLRFLFQVTSIDVPHQQFGNSIDLDFIDAFCVQKLRVDEFLV